MKNFADLLQNLTSNEGYDLTNEQIKQFSDYYNLLIETNKQINLTAITNEEEVIVKHFIDSLTVYDEKYFKKNALICDVGTGAGFPGIPLKIYKSNLEVVLLDSLAKRLKFLDKVILDLKLNNILTCHMRAEDAGHDKQHRGKYDIVIARAVAPMNVLVEYCLPLVKNGGYFIAMKGKNWQDELNSSKYAFKKLGTKLLEVKQFSIQGFFDDRAVIYLHKEKPTDNIYPRKAGTPERKPLI